MAGKMAGELRASRVPLTGIEHVTSGLQVRRANYYTIAPVKIKKLIAFGNQ